MQDALSVFFMVIYVLSAFIMIVVILLQSGKSGGLGLSFGGTTQTIFGASGGTSFLAKLTIYATAIFMVSAIILSYLSHPRSSVVETIQQTETTNTAGATKDDANKTKENKTPTQQNNAMVPTNTETKQQQEPLKLNIKTKDGKTVPIKIDSKAGSVTPIKLNLNQGKATVVPSNTDTNTNGAKPKPETHQGSSGAKVKPTVPETPKAK